MKKKIVCSSGHEGSCVYGDPDKKDRCECRCGGQNHGSKSEKKVIKKNSKK